MATWKQYREQPLEERLQRLSQTPEGLAAAVAGMSDEALSLHTEDGRWSPKEIICHLRDIEELFMLRFHMMLGTNQPTFLTLGDMPPNPEQWGIGGRIGVPLDPARLALDRQYNRNDADLALAALRRRREESLILLNKLTPEQWRRGSIHLIDGPMTFDDWVALMVEHDGEHLDQLARAVEVGHERDPDMMSSTRAGDHPV